MVCQCVGTLASCGGSGAGPARARRGRRGVGLARAEAAPARRGPGGAVGRGDLAPGRRRGSTPDRRGGPSDGTLGVREPVVPGAGVGARMGVRACGARTATGADRGHGHRGIRGLMGGVPRRMARRARLGPDGGGGSARPGGGRHRSRLGGSAETGGGRSMARGTRTGHARGTRRRRAGGCPRPTPPRGRGRRRRAARCTARRGPRGRRSRVACAGRGAPRGAARVRFRGAGGLGGRAGAAAPRGHRRRGARRGLARTRRGAHGGRSPPARAVGSLRSRGGPALGARGGRGPAPHGLRGPRGRREGLAVQAPGPLGGTHAPLRFGRAGHPLRTAATVRGTGRRVLPRSGVERGPAAD